jgi:hypothetical protein
VVVVVASAALGQMEPRLLVVMVVLALLVRCQVLVWIMQVVVAVVEIAVDQEQAELPQQVVVLEQTPLLDQQMPLLTVVVDQVALDLMALV